MPLTNLNRRLDRQVRFGGSQKKFNLKKFFIRLVLVLIFLFVVLYLPLRGVYSSAKKMSASAKALNDAVKRENLDDIRAQVKELKNADSSLNTSLKFLIWLRIIPYVGGYYADVTHFAKASVYSLSAVEKITDSLDPYKVELGFNGVPSPGQDRIAQMVKVLDKIIPQIDKFEPDLKMAADEVKSVDVEKYPENLGKYHLRSQIDTLKNFITGADYAVTQAKDAIMVAPSALGEPTPKTYLLIFQNDKELRPTGGFMTAYAFLKLDKGRISSSTSDDIYRLDEKLLEVCKSRICPLTPPDPIAKYLPEANGKPRTAWSMRDSNLSPDIPTAMQQFEKMYSFLPDAQVFDGIILIDTHVVEELIKVTGPIDIFGTSYSADFDKRCNCPNVIYELENYAQIIEKGEQDRKAILGTLMQQLLARSLGASTDKMPEFINAGVKLASNKDIIFYMKDPKVQDALMKLDWTGQIKNSAFDYLHINDANFAGGKSNLYVEQSVLLDIKTDSSGKVTNKLTIDYKNPQKYDSWLNQRNRDYVRIYVPKGSKLVSSKGSDVKVTTIDEELGKTVFEAFIEVRPQNSRTLEFEYTLPNNISGKDYPILVQKQPGKRAFDYEIKINGKSKQKFTLDADKDLKLQI